MQLAGGKGFITSSEAACLDLVFLLSVIKSKKKGVLSSIDRWHKWFFFFLRLGRGRETCFPVVLCEVDRISERSILWKSDPGSLVKTLICHSWLQDRKCYGSQGFSFSPSVWSPGGEEWSNNKERSLPMTWFHTQKAPATPPKDTDSTSNFCKTTTYIMGSFSLHHQQMQHVRIWKNIPFSEVSYQEAQRQQRQSLEKILGINLTKEVTEF